MPRALGHSSVGSGGDPLLDIPSQQRQVEDQGDPVAVDKEQEGYEPVDGDFGDDVRVEAVAEVDGVDVVAVDTAGSASSRHGRGLGVCGGPQAATGMESEAESCGGWLPTHPGCCPLQYGRRRLSVLSGGERGARTIPDRCT